MREINKEIGKRLKRLREMQVMTQAEAGDVIGVKQVVYHNIESGHRSITAGECIALAKYYGVSCDLILRGTEISADVGFAGEKLDRLAQMVGMAKALADEIYDDALIMRVENG